MNFSDVLRRINLSKLKRKKIAIALLCLGMVSACTGDISLLGHGSDPGAPAPLGYGQKGTKTSAEKEAFAIANRGVTLKTTNNSSLTVGSEDGLLAGLKNNRNQSRSAESLVDATRKTLSFMGIKTDGSLDKNTHYLETDWYNGYKATARVNKKNLHASSLDLKIIDRNGNDISPSRLAEVEDAIFKQTKIINYGK